MSAKFNTIEELVRHYVPLVHGQANGWHRVYCEYCGDGSRTKGPRGAWLFQDAMAAYHCFNNDCDGNFVPGRKEPCHGAMEGILEAFGVPANEVKLLAFRNRNYKPENAGKSRVTPITAIDLPSYFYPLAKAAKDDPLAEKARRFLMDEKRIRPSSYPFYLSTGELETDDVYEQAKAKSTKNRLIIPAFRGDEMIYYQARRLDGVDTNKYLSCDKPRANIIYNMDRLYEDIKSPLFVLEGFFDAHHLNGVAVMENDLSSQQIELLDRSPREKVVVPDYHTDNNRLAQTAVRQGWAISKPNFGSEVKDVTEAVCKYGRLFVAHEIVRNIKRGAAARIVSLARRNL